MITFTVNIKPDPEIFGERFLSKVEIIRDCWEWKAGTFKDGYGQFWYEGKGISAHRYSWIKANGAIPAKLFVLHKCDNPGCVNPNHLFLGTVQDNSDDMNEKGRAAFGERNGNSRLTKEIVEEIKKLYVRGSVGRKSDYSLKGLAMRYGISKGHVSDIVNNKIWRDVG